MHVALNVIFKLVTLQVLLLLLAIIKKQYKNSYRIYLVVEYDGEKYDITYKALIKCNLSDLVYKHKMPFKI